MGAHNVDITASTQKLLSSLKEMVGLSNVDEDTVKQAVASIKEESFLPELVDIIGMQRFLHLCFVLGGTDISIPTPTEIKNALKSNSTDSDTQRAAG